VTRHAAKVDRNHGTVRAGVRAAGYYWMDTFRFAALCPGFPDALCVNHRAQVFLFEIKMPGEGLTEDEQKFRDSYPGLWFRIETAEQAIGYLQGE